MNSVMLELKDKRVLSQLGDITARQDHVVMTTLKIGFF
ncbi:hypothetical protein Thermo_01978 [Thermoplasmatales archaeon]|nr:hypothetical protein Thermo_01978 [Thermoplasmatales archaeon]